MKIINTRPTHQSSYLSALLEKNGAQVFQLPLFEIQPISFSSKKIDVSDIIIFSSSNAVTHFFSASHPDISHKLIIAVGPATQKSLEKQGILNVVCPKQFSSEGILALSQLQKIQRKNILIICGENPKTLLKNKLITRGAQVGVIFCYRRAPISHDVNVIFQSLSDSNLIICTSRESFLQLMHLFQTPLHHQWILQKTLCVISDDMKADAIAVGFSSVIQADNATDEAIIASLFP